MITNDCNGGAGVGSNLVPCTTSSAQPVECEASALLAVAGTVVSSAIAVFENENRAEVARLYDLKQIAPRLSGLRDVAQAMAKHAPTPEGRALLQDVGRVIEQDIREVDGYISEMQKRFEARLIPVKFLGAVQ